MPNEMHALGISYERRLFGVTIVHTYRGSGSMALTTIRGVVKPTEYAKTLKCSTSHQDAATPDRRIGRQALICIKQCLSDLRCIYSLVCRKKLEFRDKQFLHSYEGETRMFR
jgi:hypothetical protein